MTLLINAIDNNIHLCDAVLSGFGTTAKRNESAVMFHGPRRRNYPSVITCTPQINDETHAFIADLPKGAGVKDSFGSLDLTSLGFRPVMNAQWIAGPRPGQTGTPLAPVTTETLPDWTNSWNADDTQGQRNFTPALIARDDIQILYGTSPATGVVINQSEPGVTGISNLFGPVETVLRGLASVPEDDHLVGYETDPQPFIDLGFAPLGPLIVWIKAS